MTPNMQVVYDYVELKYDLPVGIYNCRRISGSQTYSQHSWSNANDYYTEDKGLQDHIAAALRDEYGDQIRNILTWRYNSAHWNHIHVDMWPKGLYTPPCAGGSLRVRHEDRTRGTVFTSDLEGGDDMAAMQVIDIQVALNKAGQTDSRGRPLVEDDIYGANTEFALVNGFEAVSAGVDEVARVAAAEAHARLNKLGDI